MARMPATLASSPIAWRSRSWDTPQLAVMRASCGHSAAPLRYRLPCFVRQLPRARRRPAPVLPAACAKRVLTAADLAPPLRGNCANSCKACRAIPSTHRTDGQFGEHAEGQAVQRAGLARGASVSTEKE